MASWSISGFRSLLEILKAMVMNFNSSSYNKQIAIQRDVMQQFVVNWKCTVSMGTDDQRVLDIAVRMLCDIINTKDTFRRIIILSLRTFFHSEWLYFSTMGGLMLTKFKCCMAMLSYNNMIVIAQHDQQLFVYNCRLIWLISAEETLL